jgi:hypothetical protein
MHRALLSEKERRQIHAYLKQNGDKTMNMRQLAFLANKYHTTIRADLELIEKLLETYERNKVKKG